MNTWSSRYGIVHFSKKINKKIHLTKSILIILFSQTNLRITLCSAIMNFSDQSMCINFKPLNSIIRLYWGEIYWKMFASWNFITWILYLNYTIKYLENRQLNNAFINNYKWIIVVIDWNRLRKIMTVVFFNR